MPVYNEASTVLTAVREVLAVDYPSPMELVVVDDGSDDGTSLELAMVSDDRMRVHRHPINLGKGAAVRSGIALAKGTHVLPFDADLEYSPDDVPRMLGPIQAGRCDVVFGTRLFGLNTVYQSYRYAMGNRLTTLAANVLFDSCLSDLHTCLKLLPRDLFLQISPRERGFGLDTEITAYLLRMGVRPFEVPVTYHGRTHEQGKKLSWRDGVQCLRILGRVRFARAPRTARDLDAGRPASAPRRSSDQTLRVH
jgi:glycosyltransferase involved in cell wall biosynthesis